MKNILMTPVYFTIGYIAIIVCGTVSFFEIITSK